MKLRPNFVRNLGVWLAFAAAAAASPIGPGGQNLAKQLDAMDVEHHWIAGQTIDWQTGDFSTQSEQRATHCSAFAAAFAEKLDVYLLRPPEHSEFYLASAQQDWLESVGPSKGWKPVADPVAAQALANDGWLVLVTFKSPDPKKPGHIAIVHPSDKPDDLILAEGPQESQAGKHNFQSASVKAGFAVHKGAFENHELRYFVHATKFSPPQKS